MFLASFAMRICSGFLLKSSSVNLLLVNVPLPVLPDALWVDVPLVTPLVTPLATPLLTPPVTPLLTPPATPPLLGAPPILPSWVSLNPCNRIWGSTSSGSCVSGCSDGGGVGSC